jgi:hypothetical protein
MQFPDATVFQDGFMTATQATALAGKVFADNCIGSNSTHVNVTMNYIVSVKKINAFQ